MLEKFFILGDKYKFLRVQDLLSEMKRKVFSKTKTKSTFMISFQNAGGLTHDKFVVNCHKRVHSLLLLTDKKKYKSFNLVFVVKEKGSPSS